MRSPIFTGTCTAIVTPFLSNGTVDYHTFDALLERQIEGGVDAICVCGTTGESATLSRREHKALVARCVKRINHRIKVIAGAGSNDTATALALSQQAQDGGADALLHVTPYYNKASQTGLKMHYEYLADRIALPVILYNVPSRTGVSFTAETYAHLAQHPNIYGVKEASGNLSLVSHTRYLCDDDFFIWSGNDDQVVPLMVLGARGVISVASNIAPVPMVEMTHRCLAGDFQKAAQLQLAYTQLIDALFMDVNPIPVKKAMELLGLCQGTLRLPLCDLCPEQCHKMKSALTQVGLAS